ncbi:Tat proofreading chaperone DmsD [Adlercreutzia sp. ZJ141]|uniref:Tat proofreading chaperone DmsD n=1 Tax=Adlercreutzia sp. ZJ141 TaxID=2709406 RepID=UPI001F156810|nr:Tat proofreading chaperone DmsD [Adlercreutzia sp. ZJ141]
MTEQESVQSDDEMLCDTDEFELRDADQLEAIAFIGEALSPFYLQDPRKGAAAVSFQAMVDLDVEAAAPAWPFVPEDQAASALRMMVDSLATCRDDEGRFLSDDDLMWEYRRLFIGPGKKPTPPWGSVYTDREMVVFGKSTLELRAWMRAHGIARTQDERTPEDHIGLMLALMATLARERPTCLDEFLRDHFLTWSGHFLDELAEAAEHPFYEGLAHLTAASLDGIREARGVSVTYPRFYR